MAGDQNFWAWKIGQLGVGPTEVIPLTQISEITIESQINSVLKPACKEKAVALGAKLREENGAKRAVQIFQDHYAKDQNTTGISCNWLKDVEVKSCMTCKNPFTFFNRRHHCRSCGKIFCGKCVKQRPLINYKDPQLTCGGCSLARTLGAPHAKYT